MADKVSNMLREMEADHKHAEIFKSMVFPDTKKMRETRQNAIVKCEFQCENDQCDFSACLLEIQKNPRLLKYHSSDVCQQIVQDIATHQDDFLPSQVDGYFINRMGHELVHLKRKDGDNKGVTGFIEYNDLRKHSMDWYDHQKLKAINYIISESASAATFKPKAPNCNIM
jgi:hypothetical protein